MDAILKKLNIFLLLILLLCNMNSLLAQTSKAGVAPSINSSFKVFLTYLFWIKKTVSNTTVKGTNTINIIGRMTKKPSSSLFATSQDGVLNA